MIRCRRRGTIPVLRSNQLLQGRVKSSVNLLKVIGWRLSLLNGCYRINALFAAALRSRLPANINANALAFKPRVNGIKNPVAMLPMA